MINSAIIPPEFLSLIIAVILGACLGLERSFAGKTAGLRTYGLVSLGACLFVIIAQLIAPVTDPGSPGQMYALSGIIMGIGFIGGGTILHSHEHTSGLTTAAGLWVAGAIGAAVGYGFQTLAIFGTALTLIVFTFFWYLEHMMVHIREDKKR